MILPEYDIRRFAMLTKVLKRFLQSFVLLCLLVRITWAGDWQQMQLSDFPARVHTITFPSGHILDSNRTLTWGAWGVGFGGSVPTAIGNNYQNKLGSIEIQNLTCTNAIAGSRTCKMILWPPYMRVNTPCFIDVDGTNTRIEINCPSDLNIY